MGIEKIIEELKKNNYNFDKTIGMLYDNKDLNSEINYFKKININYKEYKKNEIENKLKNDNDCIFFYGNIRSVYTVEQYELISENIIKHKDINLEDTIRVNNADEMYLPISLEDTKLNEIKPEYDINIISPLLLIKDEQKINDILNMKENDILKIISVTEEIEEGRFAYVVKDIETIKYDVKNQIIEGVKDLGLHEVVKDIVSEVLNDNFYHDKNLPTLQKDLINSFIENNEVLKLHDEEIKNVLDHVDNCINNESQNITNKKTIKQVM